MRKSTVFISAVLTTFTLAILYGVVTAYQNTLSTPQPTAEVIDSTAMPVESIEPTATPVFITPEQAAQLAAQVVGNTNLLSVESSKFNGMDAYLVTFTNNDVVYVSPDGQIMAVQVAPVVMNVSAPIQVKHKNKDRDNNNSSSENHEDHEEKEEEHEDEHDD